MGRAPEAAKVFRTAGRDPATFQERYRMKTKKPAPGNRKFAGGQTWKIWDGPRLAGVAPGPVVFYDDKALAGVNVTWHAGVEVHQKVLVVALYGRAGETRVLGPIFREATTPAGRALLWNAVAIFDPTVFLLETTGIFHLPVAWELQGRFPGRQVVVMSAWELSKYVKRVRKNDKVDACRLAQVASMRELLRPSHVPALRDWVFREQVRYRQRRVQAVTRGKNRVKKVMAALGWHWGVNFQVAGEVAFLEAFVAQPLPLGDFLASWEGRLQAGAREALAPWVDVQVEPGARRLLAHLLRDLRVEQELETLSEVALERASRDFPAIRDFATRVTNFPGLGYRAALQFAAEVGDAHRFHDAGRFLVYAGIAPAGGTSGVRAFGDAEEIVVAQDRPNPRSNRRLRETLLRVATGISRTAPRTRRQDDLYQFARAWRARPVPKLRRKYKIAAKAGRKLFHLLRTGEPYEADVEKDARGAKSSAGRSRQARRKQAYRKEWEARQLAEKTVGVLLELLRERGLHREALAEIQALARAAGDEGDGDDDEAGVAASPLVRTGDPGEGRA